MQRKVRKRRQGCCAYRVDLGNLLEPFRAGSARRDRIEMLLKITKHRHGSDKSFRADLVCKRVADKVSDLEGVADLDLT